MSFISKIKSPLMKRQLIFFHKDHHDSQLMIDSDQPTRTVTIYHIDAGDNEGTLTLVVNNSDNAEVLLNRVCENYHLVDYKEYFGLKFTLRDEKGNYEIFWLDPLKTIGKQLKHSNNTLTFRVKHFPANPHKIECPDVRYLIFLQLKAYLQKGELQLSLNDEIILASYVLQSEYGDYDESVHKKDKKEYNYIKDKKIISKKSDKIDESIIELHKKLVGYKPEDAELKFLEHISQFNTYGAEILIVKNKQSVPVNFGVTHRGIITYLYGTPANVARIELYPWTQIGKISFENRSLHIHAHTPDPTNSEIIKKHTMVFKCNTERMCKQLWKFILDQKSFFTFNRGVDVPKLRSSKRIFGRTSKFRYSGRCEHEILVSQHDTSHNNSLNTSTYSTLHRRPLKHFKPISINDKSFTDSGLSENCAETLQKIDETTSTSTKLTKQIDTNSLVVNTAENVDVEAAGIVNNNELLKIDTNLIDNTKPLLTPPESTATNNNKIEQPTATSTPQLKQAKSDVNIEDKTAQTSSITNNSDIPMLITASNSTTTTSALSLLTTTSSFNTPNNSSIATATTTTETTNKTINLNLKKPMINRKYLKYLVIFIIIALIIILFLIRQQQPNTGIYSTVKNFIKTSANSVSLSITENIRNSQLLFDPIFSFFLRNYQN